MADGGAPSPNRKRKRFDEQGRKIRTVNSPGHEGKRKAGPRGERCRWADGVIVRSRKVDSRDREGRRLHGMDPWSMGDWSALNIWEGVT